MSQNIFMDTQHRRGVIEGYMAGEGLSHSQLVVTAHKRDITQLTNFTGEEAESVMSAIGT